MIKRIITTIFSKGIAAISNFLLVMLSAYFMGATVRGEFALIILAVSIVNMIQDIGAGAAFSYFTPQFSAKTLFSVVTPWLVIWALILPPILTFFNLTPSGFTCYITILAVLQGGISASQNYLIGRKQIYGLNLLELIKAISVLLSFLFFHFLNRDSIYSLLNAYIIGFSCTFLIAFYFLIKTIKNETQIDSTPKLSKQLFRFGIEIQANNIAQLMNYRLLYFFIEKLEGLALLGVFSVTVSIAETIWVLCRSIASIQYAKLINSTDQNLNIELTNSAARISGLLTLCGILLIMIIPSFIYIELFGKGFYQITSILPYLSIAILSLSIFTLFNHFFSASNQNKLNIKGSFLGNLILISIAYPLIHVGGIYGAACAYSTTHLIMFIYFFRKYQLQSHLNWHELIPKRSDLKLLTTTNL